MHCRKHDLNLDLFVQLILRAPGRGYTVGSAAKVIPKFWCWKNEIEAYKIFLVTTKIWKMLKKRQITFYLWQVLYPAAGGSDDWAFGGAGIPYSYTIGNAQYIITTIWEVIPLQLQISAYFLFSNFRKGRLLDIRPVGRLVGWSVDVTINFFQYIKA